MPTRRPIGQELRTKGHHGGAADRASSAGTAYGRIREWEAASSLSSRGRSRAAKAESAAAIPAEPMPQRDVPFFIQEAHEVNPGNDLDYDWTLRPEDKEKEMRLREIRNRMIKELLLEGKSIAYRQSGWSLYPRIHSNDLTYYFAVSADKLPAIQRTRPNNLLVVYAHRLHSKRSYTLIAKHLSAVARLE